MISKLVIIIAGFVSGICIGYLVLFFVFHFDFTYTSTFSNFKSPISFTQHQVIGFLPYWLIDSADKDYSKYITTLTYFGLTIAPDGSIQKLTTPTEEDPGWTTLNTNKMKPFFDSAVKNNVKLSLLIFNSDEDSISQLVSNPVEHADKLISDVKPIMKEYGFSDLNLDIESVLPASDEARQNFTIFVKEVKKGMDKQKLGTLTVEASPIVLIKNYLINLTDVSKIADTIVLMTYDYHYANSLVTGPVAPVGGAGKESEFDTDVAIQEALKIMPSHEIILGVPLYGYEWETLGNTPRSAVIPATGISASNRRVEELLKSCSTCSSQVDQVAKESFLIYKDDETGTYHQIFYPDTQATSEKIKIANSNSLGGMALWALGYDGNTILNPLENYK